MAAIACMACVAAACMAWVAATYMALAVSDTSDVNEVADNNLYMDIQVRQEADFGLTIGFLVGIDTEEADIGLTAGFPGYRVVAVEIFAKTPQTTDCLLVAGCVFLQA
ncbi:hypothetical protein ACFX1Q_033027 [Malus domestica]